MAHAHGDVEEYLEFFLDELSDMVRSVPNFPRPGINFQHVLGIAQQPGGTSMFEGLIEMHPIVDWNQISAMVCCEAGGFLFASGVSTLLKKPFDTDS